MWENANTNLSFLLCKHLGPVYMGVGDVYVIAGVTRHMLPHDHLSGVPHLHVNGPKIKMSQIRINSNISSLLW